MKKMYMIFISVCVIFMLCLCKNDKNKIEKSIIVSLKSQINEYNNGNLNIINYENVKHSKVNDSIRYYILNYNSVDIYGFKDETHTEGYFNMKTGEDVTDVEKNTDNETNRFINTEIY